jgi:hypothetical protein
MHVSQNHVNNRRKEETSNLIIMCNPNFVIKGRLRFIVPLDKLMKPFEFIYVVDFDVILNICIVILQQ